MIVFVHLFNDRSGSPKVLASAISALTENGTPAHLFVGSDGSGCLDEVQVPITRYWYRRTPHRMLTMLTYLASQVALVWKLHRTPSIPPDAVIYVNALMPFGAALYGWITGRCVVYHLHEVSVSPAPLRWMLCGIARRTAHHLIYVSESHRSSLPLGSIPATTVHNALDGGFLARAAKSVYRHRLDGVFHVLMLASLRDYKGVPEFVQLARTFGHRPDVVFKLVVNDEEPTIARYFQECSLPPNLTVHPRTKDAASEYARASLVVNLSRPDQWIETFGLTLLEAMAFGIPVIGPPVGGPVELITEGEQGFLIDSRHSALLAEKVQQLADDEDLSLTLSRAARSRAAQFSVAEFNERLQTTVARATGCAK